MSRQSLGVEDVVLKTAAGTTVVASDAPITTVVLNAAYTAAAGVTLPKSTGSGRTVRVFNAAVQTQVITIAVSSASDVMYGVAHNVDSSALATHAMGFVASATSDTVTWDGTDGTSGGKGGDHFEAIDVQEGKWFVKVVSFTTGTNDTPFSAAVS